MQKNNMGTLERLASGTSVPIDILDSAIQDIALSTGAIGGFIALGSLDYFDIVIGSLRDKRKGGHTNSISVSDLADFSEIDFKCDTVFTIKDNIYVYASRLGWFIGLDSPLTKKNETRNIIENKIKIAYPVYHQLLKRQKSRNNRDHLTGLLTRKRYFENITGNLKTVATKDLPLYIFYMDFNNFKSVNDVLGHDYGDRVLISLSSEIRKCFLGFGNAYRLGGDEFSGLAIGITDEKAETLKIDIEQITEQRPCGMYVNISVGFVKITKDIITAKADELGLSEIENMSEHFISLAEADMYVNKKNKKKADIDCEKCPYY
jgi:diguanylate cyclase (GGDEF)-like protein